MKEPSNFKWTNLVWISPVLIPIALKLAGSISWGWGVVLIPFWIYVVIVCFFVAMIALKTWQEEKQMKDAFDAIIDAKSPEEEASARHKWELLLERYENIS
jgi:hypothetical protein